MGFVFSKPTYDPSRDIPDLTGKVALITGAKCADHVMICILYAVPHTFLRIN